MSFLTLLAIVGVICFILWIIGLGTHALPGDLVSAAMVIWIVAFVVLAVVFVAHGRWAW